MPLQPLGPQGQRESPDWTLKRPAAMGGETPNSSCDLRKRKADTAQQHKFLELPSCSGLLVPVTGQTQAKAEAKGIWVAQSGKVSVRYSVKSRNVMNTNPSSSHVVQPERPTAQAQRHSRAAALSSQRWGFHQVVCHLEHRSLNSIS